jgi:hypothetical protein
VNTSPLSSSPTRKSTTPKAVMNPGYLGGEKRIPYPTDVAGLRTLY